MSAIGVWVRREGGGVGELDVVRIGDVGRNTSEITLPIRVGFGERKGGKGEWAHCPK